MPQLLVDLESDEDCRKAMEMLRRRMVRRGGGPRGERCGPKGSGQRGNTASVADLPLPQKLKRIQSRGMWKHLVAISRSAEQPLSLPELDHLLGLPKNKMRSLKAIMAKLENRFDIQFLRVEPDAGVDDSGNPRYVMTPKMRRQILRLADQ